MTIQLEILQYSYWEHFKSAKDLSLILPPDHDKRIALQMAIDDILSKMNKIKEVANDCDI